MGNLLNKRQTTHIDLHQSVLYHRTLEFLRTTRQDISYHHQRSMLGLGGGWLESDIWSNPFQWQLNESVELLTELMDVKETTKCPGENVIPFVYSCIKTAFDGLSPGDKIWFNAVGQHVRTTLMQRTHNSMLFENGYSFTSLNALNASDDGILPVEVSFSGTVIGGTKLTLLYQILFTKDPRHFLHLFTVFLSDQVTDCLSLHFPDDILRYILKPLIVHPPSSQPRVFHES
jgi:hypothetical protein